MLGTELSISNTEMPEALSPPRGALESVGDNSKTIMLNTSLLI